MKKVVQVSQEEQEDFLRIQEQDKATNLVWKSYFKSRWKISKTSKGSWTRISLQSGCEVGSPEVAGRSGRLTQAPGLQSQGKATTLV